jgi:hypothetical protein
MHTDRHDKANKEIFKLLMSTQQNRTNRLSKTNNMKYMNLVNV